MFQIFFIIALCIDAFAASFAYGIDKTKIPLIPSIVISAICTLALSLSVGIGSIIKQVIPIKLTGIICFIILFIIGVIKSFDSILKSYIQKKEESMGQIKMKISGLNFVLTVYADNIKADADHSKVLSSKEAIYLAVALSFDSLAAGLGFGLTDVSLIMIAVLSFVSNFIAISLGHLLGNFVKSASNADFSWLGGVILIILAFSKLF
jgi:putative sporulation protein YtaF